MSVASKDKIARDLEEIAYLLNLHGLCDDTSPLSKAYGLCMKHSDTQTWSYRISNLIFKVPIIGHTIPNGADDISLSFSIRAKGPFHPDEKIRNPLIDLEFNIEIMGGYLNEHDEYTFLKSAWHLDKHTPAHFEELSKFIHPEYHMTFGGRRMWDVAGFDYGQSLILPTPRLCFPPMDGILGIDFVIQNYMKREEHKHLTDSLDYKRLIGRAQERFWKPYYLAIAHAYGTENQRELNDCINAFQLIPNLQPPS